MTDPTADTGSPDAIPHKHARARLGRRGFVTLLIGAAAVGVLALVAPPHEVIAQLGKLSPAWVVASIALEIGSCVGYVVVFRRFFPEPPKRDSRQVAWISMGAGAVLPGGNFSSAAATGFLLRRHGIGTRRLIERCAALLCLLTAFGFFVNGLMGLALLLGIPGGPHDLRHAGGPLLVSAVVLGTAWLILLAGRRYGHRAPKVIRGIASGLEAAWKEVGTMHWRLLGAAAFMLLDMGALWAACAATGHPVGVPALIIAYCIGYLATAIPIPAGIGVLDAGLSGSLVLYGMKPSAAVGAVLVYHAVSIWVPGLGGWLAWLPTRGRRRYEIAPDARSEAIRSAPMPHVASA